MSEPKKTNNPAAPHGDLKLCEVSSGIAFGGVQVRPKVDGKKIIPVRAIVPLSVAQGHGPSVVKVLSDAPAGSVPGQVKGEK